jgi:hypothetical protein
MYYIGVKMMISFCPTNHIVHVHGMLWRFVGADKIFSCKDLLCNWEEIEEFS